MPVGCWRPKTTKMPEVTPLRNSPPLFPLPWGEGRGEKVKGRGVLARTFRAVAHGRRVTAPENHENARSALECGSEAAAFAPRTGRCPAPSRPQSPKAASSPSTDGHSKVPSAQRFSDQEASDEVRLRPFSGEGHAAWSAAPVSAGDFRCGAGSGDLRLSRVCGSSHVRTRKAADLGKHEVCATC